MTTTSNGIHERIISAGERLEELSGRAAAYALGFDNPLNPHERSELAATLGEIAGIGVGLQWIVKYELPRQVPEP